MHYSLANLEEHPGLGRLLHYVGDLVEQGTKEQYRTMGLNYRARYTAVLRALHAGAQTITDIATGTRLTQGAISQTVALLENDGLVSRYSVDGGRRSRIRLTAAGKRTVTNLERHSKAIFAAIANLDDEIGYPLRRALEEAAQALERKGFSARITAAKGELRSPG